MGKNNFTRKLRNSKKGVSEIIGNILILGITVTLFSSIMVYVSMMPEPQENAYADLTPSVRYIDSSHAIELNLTHKGGQELLSWSTGVYVLVNGTRTNLGLSDSLNPLGDRWTVGETFSYLIAVNPTENIRMQQISVMITDTEKNSLLYSGNVVGGTTGTDSAPIIGSRGTSPSPTYQGTQFYFYAQIQDIDKDLNANSVYIDLSSIGESVSVKMSDSNADGIYTAGPYTADLAWNGMIVVVNCSDWAFNTASGRITLTIATYGGEGSSYYGPFYNYPGYLINGTYPPDVSGGESGGSSAVGTTFYYIRKAADNTITRDFSAGEGVLIEIYSDTLINLALENSFAIYHPITGNAISPQSKSTNAFDYGSIYGTFHRYVYNFSAPSENYIYPIQMKAKDNVGTVLNIVDTIVVGGGLYPELVTYKDASGALEPSTSFNHTDVVYLTIKTKDVDANVDNVYVSDLEVSDYTGRYIIKKIPPAYSYSPLGYSAPVSCLHKTNGATTTVMANPSGGGVYTIQIVLKDAYQGWWLPRTNAYTVRIALFTDDGVPGTGEIYNQLSTQITVTAPLSTTDILAAVGSGAFTWSASGATWDNSAIKWYKGGEEWDETVIDGAPNDGPIAMALSDLDNDGDQDVVVGFQDSTYANLVWYENFQPDGKSWSSARAITMPFDARTGLQNAYSTSKGSANEDCSVWATAYSTDRFATDYYAQYELCGALTVGDFDGDGDGDVAASFVHPVVYTTAGGSGSADYTNSYGMYFNRGVYVFWNDGSWTKKALHYTTSFLALNNDNENSNPAAMDLDSADFNLDGYDDIVAVYEDGTTRVWMSQWGAIIGDAATRQNGAFGYASLQNISAISGTGSTPWSHVQFVPKVRAAYVNLDNYPDIVRTNTQDVSVTVYYTQYSTSSAVYFNATEEYAYENEAATIIGGLTDLQSSNNVYETVQETYKYYGNVTAAADMKSAIDNTLDDITDLKSVDGQVYVVPRKTLANGVLGITSFDVPSTYDGREVATASLKAMYSVTNYNASEAYSGSGAIEWAMSGTGIFASTGIVPVEGETNVEREFAFPISPLFNTYDQIKNVDIRFVNDDDTEDVEFDYMVLEIKFVETRYAGWVWQIPNGNRAYHELTIECKVSGTEKFRIAYSVDNSTWFNLTDVSAIIDTTYTFSLTPTTNDYYFVRVQDLDRSNSDAVMDSLIIDRMLINHWAIAVSWDSTTASHYFRYSTFGLGADEYLTGIAVGDICSASGDYGPDGLPDIAVCTSKIVSSSTTGALFIMTQYGGAFDVKPVYVSSLNTMCAVVGSYGSSSYREYDAKDVELGDTDGDEDLDIILVVGAAIGTTPGSGPTLWHYTNEQRYSAGAWQFTEEYVNVLATKGESAINAEAGNIDLAILLPFLGIMGVIAAEAVIDHKRRKS